MFNTIPWDANHVVCAGRAVQLVVHYPLGRTVWLAQSRLLNASRAVQLLLVALSFLLTLYSTHILLLRCQAIALLPALPHRQCVRPTYQFAQTARLTLARFSCRHGFVLPWTLIAIPWNAKHAVWAVVLYSKRRPLGR